MSIPSLNCPLLVTYMQFWLANCVRNCLVSSQLCWLTQFRTWYFIYSTFLVWQVSTWHDYILEYQRKWPDSFSLFRGAIQSNSIHFTRIWFVLTLLIEPEIFPCVLEGFQNNRFQRKIHHTILHCFRIMEIGVCKYAFPLLKSCPYLVFDTNGFLWLTSLVWRCSLK